MEPRRSVFYSKHVATQIEATVGYTFLFSNLPEMMFA
jgi:hypothetical protein